MSGFVFFLPVLFFIFYLALIFESTGITLLGFSAALFGVLSFILLTMNRNKVSVRIRIPIELAEKGRPFLLKVEVRNRAVLPIGKLRVFVEYGEGGAKRKEKAVLTLRNLPRGESSQDRSLCIERSGYYEFSIKEVRIHDYMGAFWLGRKMASITDVLILPEISEVMVRLGEGIKHFHGDAENYEDLPEGSDQSEILGVREFRDGDKLQSVHWKLSARMDDLMVKENPLPKSCPVILFMPGGEMTKNGSLDYVASLSYTLMDLKCGHYLAWNSRSQNDLVRIRVIDEESFYVGLTTFMQDTDGDCGGYRLERYREKYKGEPFLHYVYADEEGNVSVDGADPEKISDVRGELLLR